MSLKFFDFWKNKKVLIFGHTGFKGSWLVIFLNLLGAKVYGYSLKPSKENLIFNKLKLENKVCRNFYGNINNLIKISKFIRNCKPEIIINLAAQSIVSKSYKDPLLTFNSNFMGSVNILVAAKNFKFIRAILMITTDKVYLNDVSKYVYSENDKLGGADPYSSSKAASEIAIHSLKESFFNNQSSAFIATARAGNIIGGGDWCQDRLIPDIIKSYLFKKKIKIRYPYAVRPWQHVFEALFGYLMLSKRLYEKKKYSLGAWNFGPSSKSFISVMDLLKFVNIHRKLNINWSLEKKRKFKETKILRLKINKAKKFLGWKPLLNFEQMIDLTFDWYEKLKLKNFDLYKYSQNQIRDYIKNI
jgi:CDP-glucose 4,6-dehydratase